MKRVTLFATIVVLSVLGCGQPVSPPPPEPVLLAELQVWHGTASHRYAPYDSRDPAVIALQIAAAQAMGISGFVVDWYGPACGAATDEEREFQDQATAALFDRAAAREFKIALLYDEGAVKTAEADPAAYQARVISDLTYAKTYLAATARLLHKQKPVLFVFPYNDVEAHIDWGEIRAALDTPLILIDKDPDPLDPTDHDGQFDGFYAWVTATDGAWDPNGLEYGEAYLDWFYPTMQSGAYAGKVTVGGVWPGFDDSPASWGSGRFMSRRGTATYDRTMALAVESEAPFIMIETWNDFEEGSDVEFGTAMSVDLDQRNDAGLIRSSPLRVDWIAGHANPVLQAYRDGNLIFNQDQSPGVWLTLASGGAYELKLWADDLPAPGFVSRWVFIRHQDPVPGVTPVVVE